MNSNKALFLFDIDGTLISPGITARGLFVEIVTELTGKKIPLEVQHVAGFTDPLILRDMLQRAGIEGIELNDAIDKFFPIYYERLEEKYKAAADKKIYDEVGNLLKELSEEKNIYLGLVTGNMKRSAMIKLTPFGLERFFPVGAFASDDPDRDKLSPIAVGRAEKDWNVEFQNENVFVVGDTLHDIRCALVNNYRAVGIARRDGDKEKSILKSAGADWVFDTLPSSAEF
ncbi:MAG: HAD hydrolase-like protein, partial [Candidatus Marinimicrobia bacterium]|nr:HAD hydrolase-like protein [Candidatus Neomarinimicrobiota bacterium]